jgi:hypothetical protein
VCHYELDVDDMRVMGQSGIGPYEAVVFAAMLFQEQLVYSTNNIELHSIHVNGDALVE